MNLFAPVDQWGATHFSGPALKDWLARHVDYCVYISAAYLTFVFASPPIVQRILPPTPTSVTVLKKLWMVWNVALSVFSLWGATRVVPSAINNLRTMSLHDSMCTFQEPQFYSTEVGLAMAAFALSKCPEFIDTVFLIFTGKYELPFLSWFHHVTTFLFAWFSYQNGSSIFIYAAAMNYTVHTIMYFYFCLTEAGLKNVVKPFGIYITIVQIAQMVGGLFVSGYVCVQKMNAIREGKDHNSVCTGTSFMIARTQMVIYIFNFYLFSEMFYKAYLAPRPARTAPVAKKL